MDAAQKGDEALAASDSLTALQHYTRALIEHPRSPSYYIKRSKAYSRLKPSSSTSGDIIGPDSRSALKDAEIALVLAQERGKRELILAAQMRRGIAFYQLERFADAGFIFDLIMEKAGEEMRSSEAIKESMANGNGGAGAGAGAGGLDKLKMAKNGFEQECPMWRMKVKGKLGKLEEGDERAVVRVREFPTGTEVPDVRELERYLGELKDGKVGAQKAGGEKGDVNALEERKTEIPVETDLTASAKRVQGKDETGSVAPQPAPPSLDKVRHEWYQSNDSVVVTLYVKGVPKDKTDSDIHDQSISLQFPLPSGNSFDFTLDPLYAPIDPSTSKVSVMSTKIEINLRKQVPGQKWSALESSSTDVKLADRTTATSATPSSTQPTTTGPAYPTSSRHGVKDWDKVATDLTKESKSKSKSKSKKKTKKDDSGNAEAGSESESSASAASDYADGDGDPVNGFFKKLYAGADPDTRRAMVKSYTESQGTSLSTNWDEVGQGKVEVQDSRE